MEGFKGLLQSKTFWANAIGFVTVLAPGASAVLTGVDPGMMAETASSVIGAVMFCASTWARIMATKQIG